MRVLAAVVLYSLVAIVSVGSVTAQDIAVGTPCNDLDTTYRWTSSVRTKWEIKEVYAVPVGVTTPDEWENSATFNERLNAVRNENPSVLDHAQSLVSIWQDFFGDEAHVIVLLERKIDTNIRNLECISGTWEGVSEESLSTVDNPGWSDLRDDAFEVSDPNAAATISLLLQNLLNNMNTQPGAETAEIESFVVEQ